MTKQPWIKQNAWAIISTVGFGAMSIYAGIMIGQATMEMRIVELEGENSKLQKKLSGRFEFMNNATARINYLCQDDPDCRRSFEPLRVPE